MRETVTELYHLLLNKLPTVEEMNFWSTSGYSVAQLEQGAANMLLKYKLDIPTQYQVKLVMEQLWGAGHVPTVPTVMNQLDDLDWSELLSCTLLLTPR